MKNFSIKVVERLSGIKAHTIRVWEQRYGLLQPERKQARHRVYSKDDLKSLLKIVYLYNQGHRISTLALLNPAQIDDLIRSNKEKQSWTDFAIVLLIEAVLDMDETSFMKVVFELEKKFDFEFMMVQFFLPLLHRIGILWMTDRIFPGLEHFASHMVIRKLMEATDYLKENPVQRPGKIMLITPQDGFHEISLLFMRYLLKKNGYNTVYLGCNTSLDTAKVYYNKHHPTHIYVNFITNLQKEFTGDYLKKMRRIFPRVYLVASGKSLQLSEPSLQGVRILSNEEQLLDFACNIFNHAD